MSRIMNQGLSSPFFKTQLLLFSICYLLSTNVLGKSSPTQDGDPIELISYEVRIASDVAVVIEWATQKEHQNDYFLIERSTDSVYWDVIGEVGGSGNSSDTVQYTFLDREPLTGKSLYRLKQISTTGDYSYPAIKSIVVNREDSGLQILSATPNPFVDHFTISFQNSSESEVKITLFTQEGEVLLHEIIHAQQGRNEYTLNASTPLPDGLYVVSMLGKEQHLQTYLMIKGHQFITAEGSQVELGAESAIKE